MPLAMAKNMQVNGIPMSMPVIGTAGAVFVPVPRKGRLTGGSLANSAAVTGSDIVLTLSKLGDGAEQTLGTFTVLLAGTAAGNITNLVLTGSGSALYLQPGQTLKLDKTSGGAAGGVGTVALEIKG